MWGGGEAGSEWVGLGEASAGLAAWHRSWNPRLNSFPLTFFFFF